ncbi:hypothetical protein [Methylomonas koyamae]|uniref:Uncharacterized protein n=1 Tax=Methylomonas koyamae TaxID=702114 RepID=A0A291IJD7_9GAMM|nr:hypothetical protein [Methylomonas koyamae]ATG90515.1 hypothetical protein MKLM6_2292 [Methylomonas koyamae]OAI22731.1 hypothetical protein A1356_18990 [Methylomonas koyamae]
MQKLNDLYDQCQHAYKLQTQALRLLDSLSDIDNGTNPRIIHARRRAFRRWDRRERNSTRLYQTWLHYANAPSNTDSGDTFAASPAGAPEDSVLETEGQGEHSNICPFCGFDRELDSSYCYQCNQYSDIYPAVRSAPLSGACTSCGQSCDDLSSSRLCPDCAYAYAIQDDEPPHPSSMYQCPNFRPLSAGRFCACDSCNPVPA